MKVQKISLKNLKIEYGATTTSGDNDNKKYAIYKLMFKIKNKMNIKIF